MHTKWKYDKNGSLDSGFNGDGFVIHNNAAGGDFDDYGRSIVLNSIGNIYVTGNSTNLSLNTDMVIWKYNSSGELDTSFNYDGIVISNGAAGNSIWYCGSCITLDSNNNLYVTGYSRKTSNNYDMVIWKYH